MIRAPWVVEPRIASHSSFVMSSRTRGLSSFYSAFVSIRGTPEDFKGAAALPHTQGAWAEKQYPHLQPQCLCDWKLFNCCICVESRLCYKKEGEGNGSWTDTPRCLPQLDTSFSLTYSPEPDRMPSMPSFTVWTQVL